MRFPSFTEFTAKATAAFRRFPVTLTWAVLGSFIVIGLLNDPGYDLFKDHLNLILTLILGISWLISAQFFAEQFKKPLQLWWIKIIIIAFLVAIYFYLPPQELNYGRDVPYIRYVLYLLAGHIFALCAPFIMSWNDGAYFNYLKNMTVAVARGVLFSGVLYLGLVLAMLAVDFLFEIDFNDARYAQLFVFCLGIVNTWVYLSDFPRNIQFNLPFTFNKATGVFVKFILIPLAALYSIILYAYAVKILVRWELPDGGVSYLITALSALVFLIQFMLHPVRHTHGSRFIRGFSPLCYWLLLPLLPLLYTAIFRRVDDYGFTEDRYFLMVLAVFITCASVYLIWSRKKQLRFLPISLLLLILVSSVGPWGAFSVSVESQLNQMKEVFHAFPPTGGQSAPARRLGGKAKEKQNQTPSDTATITQEQSYRFGSITRYLYDRGKLSEAKGFLGYDPLQQFKDASRYSIGDSIIKKMGLQVLENAYANSLYFDYYADQHEAIHVKGYDVMRDVILNNTKNNAQELYDGFGLSYNPTYKAFELKKDGLTELTIPMDSITKNLKSSADLNDVAEDDAAMRITSENENLKIALIFKHISFDRLNGKPELQNCRFFVLLKIKNNAE